MSVNGNNYSNSHLIPVVTFICIVLYPWQLISVGSNYNYGSEDQAEFLCVVSRDISDSQEQVAAGNEQSNKAKVWKVLLNCLV